MRNKSDANICNNNVFVVKNLSKYKRIYGLLTSTKGSMRTKI